MINALLTGIFKIIIALVQLLLSPIDALIEQFLPDLSNALNSFNSFIDYILSYFIWAISWTGLDINVRTLIVAYFTFILTVPILVSTIKLAIKWYDKLKV